MIFSQQKVFCILVGSHTVGILVVQQAHCIGAMRADNCNFSFSNFCQLWFSCDRFFKVLSYIYNSSIKNALWPG